MLGGAAGLRVRLLRRHRVGTLHAAAVERHPLRHDTGAPFCRPAAVSGLTNARLLLEGLEVPIPDGSVAPFAEAFLNAGLESQGNTGTRTAADHGAGPPSTTAQRFCPGTTGPTPFPLPTMAAYPHPMVGTMIYEYAADTDYATEIAPLPHVRPSMEEVEALRAQGLIAGRKALIVRRHRHVQDKYSSPRCVFPTSWRATACSTSSATWRFSACGWSATWIAVRSSHRLHTRPACGRSGAKRTG